MPSDQPKYLPAIPWRSVGSSYLIRQVASSERIGGLAVTIRHLAEADGKLRIDVTDWQTGEPHEYADEMSAYIDAAVDGVRSMMAEHELEPGECEIVLDRFVYHPVDSHPRVYHQAGRSAFRSALEAFRCRDVSS